MGKSFYSSTFRFGIAPKTNKSLPPASTPSFFLTSCLCQQKKPAEAKTMKEKERMPQACD